MGGPPQHVESSREGPSPAGPAGRAERIETQRASRRRDLTTIGIVLASLAVIAVAVALVVSHRSESSTTATPAAAAADPPPRGVPRQIAVNMAQANRVIDASIQDKLATLKGVPVVVNQWASVPELQAGVPVLPAPCAHLWSAGCVRGPGLPGQARRRRG